MGLFNRLKIQRSKRDEDFEKMTQTSAWDILLEMIYVHIQDGQVNYHKLKGDALVTSQVRTEVLLDLLNEIEAAGGRIELGEPEPEISEEETEITSEQHFGVPHFQLDEMKKDADR